MNRRRFIDFMGKGALALPLIQIGMSGCGRSKPGGGIDPSSLDVVNLTDGLNYELLIKWGDTISENHFFGYDNDYIAYLPQGNDEGILWVNHESINPYLISGFHDGIARHRNQITKEMYNVGGSILKVFRANGSWKVVKDPVNKRITGAQQIPFEWPEKIQGRSEAFGTLANCAGGITPWGTILTCEENYHDFYGEYDYANEEYIPSRHGWESFFPNPTQHYGWVVEVDPLTGNSKKHVGLGRFAHECATVVPLPDGRVVIYSGDDINDGCLYKYISRDPGKIFPGTLYVANMQKMMWEELSANRPELAKFGTETDIMIRCREAALAVGGTQLDRPEDIEIDSLTGSVFISLTNNKPKGNYFGSIMKLTETDGDYASMTFEYDTFLTGGEETGFACPDNLAFDNAANLWFTSDISGSAIGKPPYEAFGNNGLFVVIRNGEQAGKVVQVASAPIEAEFTGPFFSPDGKTLFLSVQHPGNSSGPGKLTSHWPEGGDSVPKSAVITLQGDFLDAIQNVV